MPRGGTAASGGNTIDGVASSRGGSAATEAGPGDGMTSGGANAGSAAGGDTIPAAGGSVETTADQASGDDPTTGAVSTAGSDGTTSSGEGTTSSGEGTEATPTRNDSSGTSNGGGPTEPIATDETSSSDTGAPDGWGVSALADAYPCDGSSAGYDAVVTGNGSNWSVNGTARGSLQDALVSAFGNGGSSASEKRTVLLQDSGEIAANVQLRIPSNTVFNACGTITVVDPTGGSDRSPCYARNASHIDIPHITIRGNAQYGCFFREVDHVHIGVADIRLSGGLGMRFDNNPAGNNWANSSSNATRRSGYRLDDVYVEGTSHGVEFYGIDDITIGRVVARETSQAGLMLNNSRNIDVGLVDGRGVSPDAGYAVLRMANDNGKDWDTESHPMSVHVDKVVARESGGPRGLGIFCLTGSGGVTIDEVDIENTTGNSIWLEWCTNVKIGNPTTPSRIHNAGSFLISYGTDARMSNDLVFENIALTGTNVDVHQDCPPNIDWRGVTRDGAAVSTCQ